MPGLFRIKRRAKECRWTIVAAKVPGEHAAVRRLSVEWLTRKAACSKLHCGLMPMWVARSTIGVHPPETASRSAAVWDVLFVSRSCMVTPFKAPSLFNSNIDNSGTKADRDPRRPCCIDTVSFCPGPHVIDTLHGYPAW